MSVNYISIYIYASLIKIFQANKKQKYSNLESNHKVLIRLDYLKESDFLNINQTLCDL